MAQRLARSAALAATVMALGGASSATASTITIDADAFAAGTNISNAFAGVTLSAVGGGFGAGPSVFAVNPSIQTDPFIGSTGALVFGTTSPTFSYLVRDVGFLALRIYFPIPISWIAIDYIRRSSTGVGRLDVFDLSDVLIGSYVTGGSDPLPPVETLTLSFGHVKLNYAIASGGNSNSPAGWDNLRYSVESVPEPGTLLLLTTGLAFVSVYRARRISPAYRRSR